VAHTGAPSPAKAAAPPADADPLGPKPEIAPTPPFAPPVPEVYTAGNGLNVWLLERHALPIVSIVVTVPTGASSDPKGRPGLAFASAGMLDEGAGGRDALTFAARVDELGATLSASANLDASFVSMVVLKRNLAPAFELLGDAVVRPRFDAKEWKRVQELWVNDLRARAKDPQSVMQVVSRAALFGEGHPYAHPVSGFAGAARKTTLEEAKRFWKESWRPDRATVVAVGDVTKKELGPLLEAAFGAWKAPAGAPPAPVAPGPPAKAPRFVLVDRADAPQSVIALLRPGVAAADPDAAVLTRANTALGGSFTSRLNQDLREEHGWSYGAGSRVAPMRGIGFIAASASVVTEHTGDAAKAMMADVEAFARDGLTEEEVQKTRVHARSELVEAFEQVESAAGHFATSAAALLPPTHERDAAARRDAATKVDLDRVAKKHYDAAGAMLVVVGPRAKVLPQLQKLGLPEPEIRDEEGNKK